jgi:hypothetical protein
MLKGLIGSLTTKKKMLKDALFKERRICLPDALLNEALLLNLKKISEAAGIKFDQIELESSTQFLTLKGRATEKGISANFSLNVRPFEITWDQNHHAVRFEILNQVCEIDRSDILGILASLTLALWGVITGENFFNAKLRSICDDQGVATIFLDGLHEKLDQAVKYIDLKKIEPGDGFVVATLGLQTDSLSYISTALLKKCGLSSSSRLEEV